MLYFKVPFHLLAKSLGVYMFLCIFIHYCIYFYASPTFRMLFSIIVKFPDCLFLTELLCETDTADAPCFLVNSDKAKGDEVNPKY